MTDTAAPAPPVLRVRAAPQPDLGRIAAGLSTDALAALLPRLFALCRAAQGAAVACALGRPADPAGIAQEVLRDHLLKLCITWPKLLDLPPLPLPPRWASGEGVAETLFGPMGHAPRTAAEMQAFLTSSRGAAPVFASIHRLFAPGEAVAGSLPPATPETLLDPRPKENSVALRHLDHPAMRALEETSGRGPLWRACARLYDVEMALAGSLPAIARPAPGCAVVPATRGFYAIRIETRDETVTALTRVTPTDSLLAPGGILARALATLPPEKTALAPLLLDILDPCSPVTLEAIDA
ncbi:hydrogenase expression/formation protein HupK [Pseudooceanicola sp. CBS1P-1]|uniref:Hydrogenase expression/formation protein HupK n=1 Tax=Pseudooceanicola albus TaxID=2692189 RepID=A0A6L7G832_9RHOB|nr:MULTISPECIES: hydrogenase expression/formation protein HupK [Pseudooceanicola]MBT9384203.1 hydrogenase expression/formation protein HupK [Pseudooceanicola endophyticus]MXN19698.1 hydrogenase expression/formation protein HupK [Pseudooceanicola albus]